MWQPGTHHVQNSSTVNARMKAGQRIGIHSFGGPLRRAAANMEAGRSTGITKTGDNDIAERTEAGSLSYGLRAQCDLLLVSRVQKLRIVLIAERSPSI